MTTLELLESKLGESLNVLGDACDLHVRQGNTKVIAALQAMNEAWTDIALLMNAERRAAIQDRTFAAIPHGGSVVDALFEFAVEQFPRSLSAQRAIARANTSTPDRKGKP